MNDETLEVVALYVHFERGKNRVSLDKKTMNLVY